MPARYRGQNRRKSTGSSRRQQEKKKHTKSTGGDSPVYRPPHPDAKREEGKGYDMNYDEECEGNRHDIDHNKIIEARNPQPPKQDPKIVELLQALADEEHPTHKACKGARTVNEDLSGRPRPTALLEALREANSEDLMHPESIRELLILLSDAPAGSIKAKAHKLVAGSLKCVTDMNDPVWLKSIIINTVITFPCSKAEVKAVCVPGNIVCVHTVEFLLDKNITFGADEFVSLPSGPGHHKLYMFCILWISGHTAWGVLLTSKQGHGILSVLPEDRENYRSLLDDGATYDFNDNENSPVFSENIRPRDGSMICLTQHKIDLRRPVFKTGGRLTTESAVRVSDMVAANKFAKDKLMDSLKNGHGVDEKLADQYRALGNVDLNLHKVVEEKGKVYTVPRLTIGWIASLI